MKIEMHDVVWLIDKPVDEPLPKSLMIDVEDDTPSDEWVSCAKYAAMRLTGYTVVSCAVRKVR